MTDHGQITAWRSAPSSARLEEAINHLSLGIVIFDEKREVVFCNERYREMYALSPEQVKPGTPTSELIQHRLDLGLKVPVTPDDYIRQRVGRDIALDTTVQEFADGHLDFQLVKQTIEWKAPARFDQLRLGNYSAHIMLAGYESSDRAFEIESGSQPHPLKVKLARSHGAAKIDSLPTGAAFELRQGDTLVTSG